MIQRVRIVQACFKANGNPYVIASLEWLCRQLEGRSIDTASQIDYQRIVKELEIPVAQYPIALRLVFIKKYLIEETYILMLRGRKSRN